MNKSRVVFFKGVIVLLGLLAALVFAVDTDFDGMDDSYELFFGLSATNSADAAMDPDGDALTNLQESVLWTDPFSADTDCDGFIDSEDSNALSRAVMMWGRPEYTDGGQYFYTGPQWWLGAEKTAGEWSEENGWSVAQSNEFSELNVSLDRNILTNNLVMGLLFDDQPGSTLKVRLLDTNSQVVVSDLTGNIVSGTSNLVYQTVPLPLVSHPAAAVVGLYVPTNAGPVNVHVTSLYIDDDHDGLDFDQELQMRTSDSNPDCDGDGLSDGEEVLLVGTDPLKPDTDEDGLGDAVEAAGSIFQLMRLPLNWKAARDDAEQRGGHLATITSEAEHIALVKVLGLETLSTLQPWIGASDAAEEGLWKWVTDEPFEYARWGEGLPDNKKGKEHYAQYFAGVFWNDAKKWKLFPYIVEFDYNLDPLDPDFDDDNLLDGTEIALGTDPLSNDTDGDGVLDGDEVAAGLDPLKSDSDGDGLTDVDELNGPTDPLNPDCDDDGLLDGDETRFLLVDNRLSWNKAKADALLRGGYLATITSEEEHEELLSVVGIDVLEGKAPWIGASDKAQEGVWVWVTGEAFSYSRWHADETAVQPDNLEEEEHYACYDGSTTEWFDATGKKRYLIEYAQSLDPFNPDCDGDGLSDGDEINTYGSSPFSADSDGDGLGDAQEVELGTNPSKADSDSDGLCDMEEINGPSDPVDADTDDDGLIDGMEFRYVIVDRYLTWHEAKADAEQRGGYLAVLSTKDECDEFEKRYSPKVWAASRAWIGATDEESEGIWKWITGEPVGYTLLKEEQRAGFGNNFEDYLQYKAWDQWKDSARISPSRYLIEYDQELDPLNPDCDGDGVSDGDEVWVHFTNPFSSDTDGDGLTDLVEINLGLDPCVADSDRDTLPDGDESGFGLDPLTPDADGDGLLDGEEVLVTSTDPFVVDSNTNGIADLHMISSIAGVDTFDRFTPHISVAWEEEGDALTLTRHYNDPYVVYELDVAEPGIYRLAFETVFEKNAVEDDGAQEEDGEELEEGVRDTHELRLDLYADGFFMGALWANKSDVLPEYTCFTPWLSEGRHKIRVHVWGEAPKGRFTIESVDLYAVDGVDADGDGIQDWMKTLLEQRGASDTDGDGISDLDEVSLYGSNPLDEDSDHDGLNDGAELAAGTGVLDADSDEDGVVDGAEVNELFTNPLVAEFDGTVETLLVLNGSDTNSVKGDWRAAGTALESHCRRGELEYLFTLPTQDVVRLEIEAAHLWNPSRAEPTATVESSELDIYVDGLFIGTRELVSVDGDLKNVQIFLPQLSEGEHTLTVFWENLHRRLILNVNELRFQQLGGPDTDEDGTKDWVQASLAAMTGIDETMGSIVSPVCLEGDARYPELAILNIQHSTTNVQQGVGERWFANVNLNDGGVATDMTVSFQNGAREVSVSTKWVPYNMLDHNGATLTLRKGDSLRLTCIDPSRADDDLEKARGGQFELNVFGEWVQSPNTRPVTVLFDEAGTFNVNGTYRKGNSTISAAINVQVVDWQFPEKSPACLFNVKREWVLDLPESAVLEVDETVEMNLLSTVPASNGLHKTTYSLRATSVVGRHVAVARLYSGGPIVDAIDLWPFQLILSADNGFFVVERFEDSQLWETAIIGKNLPEDLALLIDVFAGGVVLEDYTIERWLTAGDFGETGEYTFRLYHPDDRAGSACYGVELYQGDALVGRPD